MIFILQIEIDIYKNDFGAHLGLIFQNIKILVKNLLFRFIKNIMII
jgi:hypothetical protein